MPDPDSKSPSFDFLNDLNSSKRDEPAPEAEEPMFDFGIEAEGEPAPETPPEERAPVSAEAPSDAPVADDMAFFDDLLSDEPAAESAADAPQPAEPTGDEALFAGFESDETPVSEEPHAPSLDSNDLGFLDVDGLDAAPAAPTAPEADEAEEFGFLPAEDAAETTEAPADDAQAADWEPAGDEPAGLAEEELLGAAMGAAAGLGAIESAEAFAPPEVVEEPLPPDPEINDPPPTPAPLAADDPQMQTYAKLCAHVREASTLGAVEAVLGWDERCMMPAAGAEQRAEQITLLSGMIHDRLSDPRIGEWLAEIADGELAKDPHDDFGATIRQIRRQFQKRTKLPKSLVEELAHTAVMGQHVWQDARKNDDFASFAPLLSKLIDLKRQQAECLGYAETPYDALLDEFEPGELTSRVTSVLGALRDELVPLVAQIREGGRSPDLSILERSYPIAAQRALGRDAAAQIGFDFERGRLDVTAHPFCTGLGPNDCRITTRYDEHFFNAGFFGILHEAGHGIYDQGLRPDQYGLPVGEAVSMGIHESQSRLWEILVGRSLPFWRHMYPAARQTFPAALGDVTLGRFFFAVNDVRPSLIRVEADEFTYNLHILIRFELEQALIGGDLSVNDLPGAWREKYREYLGLEVPNDADGVLQDIHWSAGLFGYFPTYSLGNLYAAQFYEQADRELGGLDRRFARGEFTLLRRWLQAKIHREGQRYTAAELCEKVTGGPLSHEPLMRHLRAKYDLLYAPDAASLDDLDVSEGDESATMDSMTVGDDEGYAVTGDVEPTSFGGFGGEADVGTATVAAPVRRTAKKKGGGWLTSVILIGGIVGGGVLGSGLGLWIVMWLQPNSALVQKARQIFPAWMFPAQAPADDEPLPVVPPRTDQSPQPTSYDASFDAGRLLTERVLKAARSRL